VFAWFIDSQQKASERHGAWCSQNERRRLRGCGGADDGRLTQSLRFDYQKRKPPPAQLTPATPAKKRGLMQ